MYILSLNLIECSLKQILKLAYFKLSDTILTVTLWNIIASIWKMRKPKLRKIKQLPRSWKLIRIHSHVLLILTPMNFPLNHEVSMNKWFRIILSTLSSLPLERYCPHETWPKCNRKKESNKKMSLVCFFFHMAKKHHIVLNKMLLLMKITESYILAKSTWM